MNNKKLIPCFYLKNGQLIKGFKDNEQISDDPVSYAVKCSNQGADELILFDLSEGDEEHEEALLLIRAISRAVDIPIIGAGNIKRTEDVKKLIYAGCKYAALNMAKQANIDLMEEVSKRFGREKIMACADAEEQILNSFENLKKYTSGVLLLNKHIVSGYKDLPLIPLINNSTEEELFALLKKKDIAGISGDMINSRMDDLMKFKRSCKDNGILVNTFESCFSWDDFKKNSDGHITVVVQDYKTDAVLMVAYMDQEAYEKTIETGIMTYYSRSRNELWVKGATSGHYQYVRSLTADCDLDTLLAKVAQTGAACHTGRYSCFFNEIIQKDFTDNHPLQVFENVYSVIMDKKEHPKEGSYTNYLFDKGMDKILKKIGEEATEIVIAAKNPDKEEVKYEIADFLYHAMVLMAECDLTWTDITRELANR
ncbi:MAG TPA: bifunctional phosphoribosyl-AMP cyclohydrolase/phosphoribosyl-ATP diphosphatase HisIE [Lachnospiraceae bacterium]|nr:bifunctional phosphoribosyl-AMP cyclohydrolase/phosphoribosyl-ATP diphosphatase HisIE [Lachnospiraceae bacterium]